MTFGMGGAAHTRFNASLNGIAGASGSTLSGFVESFMHINEEQAAFYFEIGFTITQWAHVENALAEVAAACVHKSSQRQVMLGFFELESFRAKLAFVDAVVRSKPKTDARQKEWGTLSAKASELSLTRNKLAHNMVMVYTEGQAGRRYVLRPWVNKEKNPPLKKPRPGTPPSSAIGVRAIIAFRYEGFALNCALQNFACKIARRKMRFPAHVSKPRDPPTIHDIAAQMRALSGQQTPPSQG